MFDSPPPPHPSWLIPLALVLSAVAIVVTVYMTTRQTVGLYLCRNDLYTCGRLLWVNSLTECRAAAIPYRALPVKDGSLVCIRQKAFEVEGGVLGQ